MTDQIEVLYTEGGTVRFIERDCPFYGSNARCNVDRGLPGACVGIDHEKCAPQKCTEITVRRRDD
jgi:hypothetical protein